MKHILIVEDDKTMNRMLVKLLQTDQFEVCAVSTLAEALLELNRTYYDLAVLDVNLPDGSGYEIIQKINQQIAATAVIFLTANDLEQDIIEGYELGAVDYITKPFSAPVLLHKVNAILSLLHKSSGILSHEIYDDGFLFIDFSAIQASMEKHPITFAPLEYRILEVFIKNKGILLTRQKLFEKLWDIDNNFVEEHTLTAAISRIRKKIEGTGRNYIQTVYGMGYMFTGGDNHNE